MTNLRTLSDLFKAAKKLAGVCAFAIAIAVTVSAQTPTNTFPDNGNAGVGTTTPPYPLTIQSAPTADPFVQGYFKSTSTSFPYGGVAVDGNSQSHIRFMLGGTLKWQWRVGAGTAVDDLRAYNWTLGADVMTLKNNGNVGIGTTNPGNYRLYVSGPLVGAAGYTSYIADGLFGATAVPSRISTNNFNGGILFGYEDLGLGDYSPRVGLQQTFDATHSPSITTTKASIGLVRNGNITIRGGASHTEFFRIDNSGNVGIGTGSPGAKLEVAGDGLIRVTEGNRIVPISGVGLELSADTTGSYVGAYNRSTSAYRRLYFYGSPYVFEGGNVGIGTTPAHKLDVAGNTNITGNITVAGTGNITAAGTIEGGNIKAKYQDIAEWVPSSEEPSAGAVVVLDTTKSNQVVSSSVRYDTRVAGVISAQPGITLGESGAGKVLVATTGRVRVKVDASRGAIQIGDLLVTSDVSGVAMKSEAVNLGGVQFHRPGTIIGKALEPLAKGQGEILVLLSLQ